MRQPCVSFSPDQSRRSEGPRRRLLSLTFAFVALAGVIRAEDAQTPGGEPAWAEGRWSGEIELPGQKLAVVVTLQPGGEAAGSWSGTIDIPVQGIHGFKLGDVAVSGRDATFVMPGVPGGPTFKASAAEDGRSMAGTFTQGGASLPLRLEKASSEAAAPAAEEAGVAGEGLVANWQGQIDAGTAKLRMVLKVTEDGDGLAATLVSVDQGGAEIAVSDLSLSGRKVTFESSNVGGSFEGSLSEDGSELEGTWTQLGRGMPMKMVRLAGEVEEMVRPQDPVGPLPYAVEEVTFAGGGEGVTLAGTLTIPEGDGPFPAVALLTGSGPQNRDEEIMGHRPFLVLADHLSRRGVAVLRFDDRGIGESTGQFETATTDDFAADAGAAVEYLSGRKDVDTSRLGLIGHSEGGITGPAAAVADDRVRFLVLLAAPGVPMSELLCRQTRDLLAMSDVDEAEVERQVAVQKEAFAILKEIDGPEDEDVERLRKLLKESSEKMPAALRAAFGGEAGIEANTALMTTPWFRKLAATDPRPVLRKVDVPVLAINGETDMQVAAEENLKGVEAALREGGNTAVRVVSLPGLNHLFQHSESGSPMEYGQIEETFAPEALGVISDWINER